MRIALLHNHKAGRSKPIEELCDLIRQEGHVLTQLIDRHGSSKPVLHPAIELVVAAGGDGTVATAGRLALSRALPMTILPLGTANNIAHSMGISGAAADLVARWRAPTRLLVDVGVARTMEGEQFFFESVGAGLVPAVIDSMRLDPGRREDDVASRVAVAVRRYGQLLPLLSPTCWDITADGVRAEHELLMFEVLNMRTIGPNLTLVSDTSATDGMLTLVMIGEHERERLSALLEAHDNQAVSLPTFPGMRVKRVEIRSSEAVHVDDRVHWPKGSEATSLTVNPGALTLLA